MPKIGVVLSWWFFCFSFPFVVWGCSCLRNPFELTDLEAACSDYHYSNDMYAATVVDSDWCRCFDSKCGENHTVEVVEVFKGSRQIGDRIVLNLYPKKWYTRSSCNNAYDVFLYIGTTYLFGIGGVCSRIKMWTPYSNFSHEIIQAITSGCSGCHVVRVEFDNHYNNIINESNNTLSFNLLLSNPISIDITVQIGVTTYSYSTESVDPGICNVTFPAGSTNASFSIDITDDTIYEFFGEYVYLTILKDSLPTCSRLGYRTAVSIIILDNDVPISISFSKPTYSVKESFGQVQLQLLLTGSYSAAVVVKVQSRDITATGKGVDYNSGPYKIVFPPGVTKAPFNITINGDDAFEGTESFKLLIQENSLPIGIWLGKYSNATVSIYN